MKTTIVIPAAFSPREGGEGIQGVKKDLLQISLDPRLRGDDGRKMKKRILSAAILLSFLIIAFLPFLALAAEVIRSTSKVYWLNVPIGGRNLVNIGEGKNPLFEYISVWYGFIIGSIGILATVIIMYGGFKWLTSRGNTSQIADAKEKIIAAITGLLLAFLSYTILNLINPRLVQFTTLEMEGIQYTQNFEVGEIQFSDISSSGSQYPLDENSQNSNTQTLRNRSNSIGVGENVRVDGLTPEIMNVVYALRDNSGNNIAITSGYRPYNNGSQHALGRAVDLSRQNSEFNDFMREEVIGDAQPNFYYENQPGYFLTYNGIAMTVINENINNCWHIDVRQR